MDMYTSLLDAVRLAKHPETGRSLSKLFAVLPSPSVYPDYYEVIQSPISFKEIKAKIDKKSYASLSDLRDDLLLMLANCIAYNEEGSDIYANALTLQKIVSEKYTQLMNEQQSPSQITLRPQSRNKRVRETSMSKDPTPMQQEPKLIARIRTSASRRSSPSSSQTKSSPNPRKRIKITMDAATAPDYRPSYSPTLVDSISNSIQSGDLNAMELLFKTHGPDFTPNSLFPAPTHAFDNDLDTPFTWNSVHAAAFYGHNHLLVWLSAHGGDVNSKDTWYSGSPLGWAAYGGHVSTCRLLVNQLHADHLQENSAGQVPMDLVPDPDNPDWVDILVNPKQPTPPDVKATPEVQKLAPPQEQNGEPAVTQTAPIVPTTEVIPPSAVPVYVAPSQSSFTSLPPAMQQLAVDYEAMWKLVQGIFRSKDSTGRLIAEVFQALPDRQEYPDYYEAIPRPISLTQIVARIQQGLTALKHAPSDLAMYTIPEFRNDIMCMFANALFYNEEGSQIYLDAVTLLDAFKREIPVSFKESIVGVLESIDVPSGHIVSPGHFVLGRDDQIVLVERICKTQRGLVVVEGVLFVTYEAFPRAESFLPNEIFRYDRQVFPGNYFTRPCYVMPPQEFLVGVPSQFVMNDIYICEYQLSTKSLAPIPNWISGLIVVPVTLPLVPHRIPMQLRRADSPITLQSYVESMPPLATVPVVADLKPSDTPSPSRGRGRPRRKPEDEPVKKRKYARKSKTNSAQQAPGVQSPAGSLSLPILTNPNLSFKSELHGTLASTTVINGLSGVPIPQQEQQYSSIPPSFNVPSHPNVSHPQVSHVYMKQAAAVHHPQQVRVHHNATGLGAELAHGPKVHAGVPPKMGVPNTEMMPGSPSKSMSVRMANEQFKRRMIPFVRIETPGHSGVLELTPQVPNHLIRVPKYAKCIRITPVAVSPVVLSPQCAPPAIGTSQPDAPRRATPELMGPSGSIMGALPFGIAVMRGQEVLTPKFGTNVCVSDVLKGFISQYEQADVHPSRFFVGPIIEHTLSYGINVFEVWGTTQLLGAPKEMQVSYIHIHRAS